MTPTKVTNDIHVAKLQGDIFQSSASLASREHVTLWSNQCLILLIHGFYSAHSSGFLLLFCSFLPRLLFISLSSTRPLNVWILQDMVLGPLLSQFSWRKIITLILITIFIQIAHKFLSPIQSSVGSKPVSTYIHLPDIWPSYLRCPSNATCPKLNPEPPMPFLPDKHIPKYGPLQVFPTSANGTTIHPFSKTSMTGIIFYISL